MNASRLFALGCMLAAPASLLAASPWDGSWKLDLSRSHYEGQSFTYSKGMGTHWKVTAGNVAFEFGTDGKPYATVDPDDTMVATMKGDHELVWDNVSKGQKISTTDETLSGDGKTLTDHTTGTRPDGSKIDETTTYTRESGTGFMGKWKSTKYSSSHAGGYTISTAADGLITWDIPDYKNTVKVKADGKPGMVTGPTAAANSTLTLHKVGATELTYAFKIGDKTLSVGELKLVDGGKGLTDTSWNPGTPAEKSISYYVKQ